MAKYIRVDPGKNEDSAEYIAKRTIVGIEKRHHKECDEPFGYAITIRGGLNVQGWFKEKHVRDRVFSRILEELLAEKKRPATGISGNVWPADMG